jgi:signal transduction histidine kinase
MWDYLSQEHLLTLAVLSPDLIVLDASEKFREFQQDPALTPVGKPVSELIWELVGSETALQDVLQGRSKNYSLENINRETPAGATLYLSIKIIPLPREELGRGLLLIIEDTTARSMLEQQLVQERNELRLTKNRLSLANEELRKLNRLKSIFLSIAAHDLRSPLTAIWGYTDLAMSTLPRNVEDVKSYLSTVLSLVDTLNRLIGDFLDLDIIEQGNLKIRREPCDLNTLVLEVFEIMGGIARRKSILIDLQLSETPIVLYADPDRMRQMLYNLLGNAIKYTNQGDRIQLETAANENYGLFRVSDHGPGIPEAELPRLFDLYQRTEAARQSPISGHGLGLFIVKSLVDLHGGQISVRSELGQGTEFTVSLPLYQAGVGGKG